MNRCEKCGLVIFGENFRCAIPDTPQRKGRIVTVCRRCCHEILMDWIMEGVKAPKEGDNNG